MAKNRAIPKSIIKCVEYGGHNGIALWGHRDDSTSTDISQGKYKALRKFCTDSSDELLQSHVESCSSRETHLLKTSQNQLLQCMGDLIRDCIVAEVKESHYFSISADEVMSLVGSS